MSAGLSTPTLPAFINMEDLQAFIQSEIQKAVKPLKEEIKDLRATLNDTQELLANACLKIKVIENSIFSKDEDGEIIKNEDDKPVISPEITSKAPEPAQKETDPVIPLKTTLEKKAVAFAEWLFKKPYSPTGVIQADDKEIKEFINDELDEKLRGKDKSDRKIKMRIINKAKELYPGKIEINKNPKGRHKTSVFVKNSFQPTRTVRTPLFLAGELI
jgi:hypothetical protein